MTYGVVLEQDGVPKPGATFRRIALIHMASRFAFEQNGELVVFYNGDSNDSPLAAFRVKDVREIQGYQPELGERIYEYEPQIVMEEVNIS